MGMNLTDKAKNSKTFCVYPWIHIHTSPMGAIAPCCIGASVSNTDLADEVKGKRLDDLVNHDRIKQLRLDMLAGKKCSECKICYELEDAGVDSFRVTGLREYPEVAEELVTDTNIDGSLSNFEMRYFDMRFSNICNFKCRTCGQEYSSQWEQENFREGHIRHIKAALNWSCSKDTSDNIDGSGYTNAINFRNSIEELDKIRGESFEKVFPELIPILESTYE